MGRKRQENIIEMATNAPWYFGVALAAVSYGGLKWLLPSLLAESPLLVQVSRTFSKFAWMVAILFLLAAGISFFRQSSGKNGRVQRNASHPHFSPNLKTNGIGQNRDEHRPEIIMPELPPHQPETPLGRPDSWSLKLLRALEWHRFEKLAADFYTAQGYKARVTRHGADGGIDAELSGPEDQKTTTLLQCKAWNVYKVGIKPVRELFGVMAAQNVPNGIFMTTGEFTKEAADFAQGKPLELIDGTGLLMRILKLPADVSRALLECATDGDYTTPTCPTCGIKMTRRSGKNGAFWGCVRYPRCQQTFTIPSSQRFDK